MPLVLRWRRQGLTDSTRPEYRFVQESRIHPLGTGPKDLSEFGLLSKSIRLGDAMSLCCFSQEQQQQRQSALLGAGHRALPFHPWVDHVQLRATKHILCEILPCERTYYAAPCAPEADNCLAVIAAQLSTVVNLCLA